MRVVYSIGSRLAGGGIGNTAWHAVRAIHRAGCLARLISLGHEPVDIPSDLMTSLWYPSRRYLRLSPLRYYWLKDRSYDRRAAKLLRGGFDLFHGWNSHCLRCLRRARDLGAVTFVERASAHPAAQARLLDEEHDRFGLPRPRRLQKLVDRCVEEIDMADFVRIPSDFARRTFLEEGFPEDRLVQAPFGVDAERFTVHPEPDRFTALYVGDVGLRKGALDLLEAWKLLGWSSETGPRLLFRGWVDDAVAPLIDGYRGQCVFETPGFTPDVAAAYAEATVFVLPALEDGYPLVVLEAMASGRPVIVSENTGSKDAVEQGVTGFIVPVRAPEAIADRLQWLYEHPEERAAMGAAARQRALELPWDRFGASVVSAHAEALRRLRGNGGEAP